MEAKAKSQKRRWLVSVSVGQLKWDHTLGTTGMGCEHAVRRRENGDFDKHIESFWASLKSGEIGIKQWPFSHYKIGKILNGDIIRKKDTFYMIRWSINESSQ